MFRKECGKIIHKRITLRHCSLITCLVHAFKFYFVFYKCLMWPPPAERTTASGYENSSKTRLRISRLNLLIAAVVRFFLSSIFVGSGALRVTYLHKKNSNQIRMTLFYKKDGPTSHRHHGGLSLSKWKLTSAINW